MARTTVTQVRLILPDENNTDEDVVNAMITSANLIVTDTLGGSGLSDDILADIEKWFAAHLIYMGPERQLQKINVEDTGETYGKLGYSLDSTTYGQTVKALDPTGKMNGLGKKAAKIEAITSFE